MKSNRGFTLLELLVVMVILGTLVTIGLRSFTSSQMKARDARRKEDLIQVTTALELFHSDKGYYPVNNEFGQIVAYDNSDLAHTYVWGETFNDPDQTVTIYAGNLPQDPSGLRYYYQAYTMGAAGWEAIDIGADQQAQAYRIYAFLENIQDNARVSGTMPDDDIYCHDDGDKMPCNYFINTSNLSN